MKISRDRLKQIIKEELQSLALAEVEHTASDEEEEVAPALARDRKQRGVDAAGNPIALPVDDAKALDAAAREAIKQNAGADVSPFDPRDDLPSKYGSESEQFTGPGGQSVRDMRTQLGMADPLRDPVDAIGSTGFGAADVDMDALRARDAQRAKRLAGKKRVASKGKLTGRSINAKWRAGEFGPYEGGERGTKSHANWLRVRRALANKGQDDAHLALVGVAGKVHGVSADGSLSAKAAQVVGIPKPAPRAVAKKLPKLPAGLKFRGSSTKAATGPKTGDPEADMAVMKKGLNASELSASGQAEYQEIYNTLKDQAESDRDATVKAREIFKKRNRIAVKKRSAQRRLAKQKRDQETFQTAMKAKETGEAGERAVAGTKGEATPTVAKKSKPRRDSRTRTPAQQKRRDAFLKRVGGAGLDESRKKE